MFDIAVTPEVADAIAEIGRVDPRYHSPEGELFRKALELVEKFWVPRFSCAENAVCIIGGIGVAARNLGFDRGNLFCPNSKSGEVSEAIHRHIDCDVGYWSDSHTHAENISMLTDCGFANGWL